MLRNYPNACCNDSDKYDESTNIIEKVYINN